MKYFLEVTASILTIFTFLLLIISKIIQYHKVNMKDKTVIISYIKGEFYSQQWRKYFWLRLL